MADDHTGSVRRRGPLPRACCQDRSCNCVRVAPPKGTRYCAGQRRPDQANPVATLLGGWAESAGVRGGLVKAAHCASTPIDVLSRRSEPGEHRLSLARRVCDCTLAHMWDPRGFFYFRRHRLYTNRVPFMRLSQAHMPRAFMSLLVGLEAVRGEEVRPQGRHGRDADVPAEAGGRRRTSPRAPGRWEALVRRGSGYSKSCVLDGREGPQRQILVVCS